MKLLSAAALLFALLVPSTVVRAQPAAGPSGHWKGTLEVPTQALDIEIDLAQVDGKWQGAIAIPAQGLRNFPLSAISVEGDTASFAMAGVPGSPQFKGTLSKDGKSLAGDFTQGGGTIPFSVTRTGDAKIEPPPQSTPITKDLEGAWEGPLDVKGTILRLALKLASGPDGKGTGTMVSLDQGSAEIPIAAVVQTGSHVKLAVQAVAGTFEGDLKDGQLIGTWTQGPLNNLPLVFKRPAAK